MANKYWFKPKKYGYGATPSSWEGWFLTLFIILIIIARTIQLQNNPVRLIVELIIIIVILTPVTKIKTKGEWKWR